MKVYTGIAGPIHFACASSQVLPQLAINDGGNGVLVGVAVGVGVGVGVKVFVGVGVGVGVTGVYPSHTNPVLQLPTPGIVI